MPAAKMETGRISLNHPYWIAGATELLIPKICKAGKGFGLPERRILSRANFEETQMAGPVTRWQHSALGTQLLPPPFAACLRRNKTCSFCFRFT